MKKILSIFAVAAALVACNQGVEPELAQNVTLEPIITRALALNFNTGNKIGVKMTMADNTVYAENALLTYNGTVFSGEQKWYADGAQTCDIIAYYPYQEAFPTSFTVEADQSEGTDASDFMAACVSNVRPTSAPVLAAFKHKFVQLDVVINSDFDAEVEEIALENLNPKATIAVVDGDITATADATAEKINIIPETITANKKYAAVVVPQDLQDMGLRVKVKNGATLVTMVSDKTLNAGYRYTISVAVSSDQVTSQISGEIEDWNNGGNLDSDTPVVDNPVYEDHIADGYIMYHDLRYNVGTFGGKVWMTEPMAYVPEGVTVSSDPAAASGSKEGVFYPYSSDGTTCTPLTDAESIKALGYFYKVSTAFGAEVTKDNCTSFEGCQGICPEGWHIPSRADYFALCGNSNASKFIASEGTSNQTNPDALFYDSAFNAGTVEKFNEGGFNYTMAGCVANNAYNKLITSDTDCDIESLVGKLKVSYSMTSSAQSVNTSDAPQMFVLMTTFTSTNNKGKVSLAQADYIKVASTLRCVKD